MPMKRVILILLISINLCWGSETPFKRGVNLTGWLQASGPRQIQFTRFTRQDIVNIKSLGCDVIRLPMNLHFMTDGAPDYTIDPLFYNFLDQIVDWTEELHLHLILDNHTFDPRSNTDPNIEDVLVRVWKQMAAHYKERSSLIYYEILNEPHGISDQLWNETQQNVINAIRNIDQKHTIIVGPAGWNSYNNLKNMPQYEDDNLIYTFHFYDPFLFTHQGASWTSPSLVSLAGVPFPYDASRMPDCPDNLENTWVKGSLANYRNEGTVEHVKELIDIAVAFQNERNVPLFCGEFGVYKPNSSDTDRVYWYSVVRNHLEEKDISWTIWDYKGGFGLFKKGTDELFDYDLNVPLVEALDLTAPPQKETGLEP
jgi:endoglucanase